MQLSISWRKPDSPATNCLSRGDKHTSVESSSSSGTMGKPQGIRTGRKHRMHRREQRWAKKSFAKSHSNTKYNLPMAGASMSKGIVLEKIGIEAKQPNSAIRKSVRVQLYVALAPRAVDGIGLL